MPLPNRRVGGKPPETVGAPTPAGMPGQAGPGDEPDVFEEDMTGSDNRRVIDPGLHCAKCINVVQDVSKEKGNKMYVFDWIVTAGQFKGEKPRSWNSCVPAARWKLAETLRALGVPITEDDKGNPVLRFSKADCLNKPVLLKIVYDESREQHKVDKVLAPTAEAIKAASASPVI